MPLFPLIRVLREGSNGPDVSAVKMALQAWHDGVIGNTTGVYGPGAVRAVKAFQRSHALAEDGIYGSATHKLLTPFFTAKARALYESALLLVQPVPKPYATGKSSVHPTAGLPDFPAIDFFAASFSPVLAPEICRVQRFSGHDPALGPIEGPHGPLGWSIYLVGLKSGTTHYATHLGTRTCTVGDTVKLGQKIGTIADYAKYGTPSHVHWGVNGGTVSISELAAAPLWAGS